MKCDVLKSKIKALSGSEFVFYTFAVMSVFVKFWFAEFEISACYTRAVDSVAASLGFFAASFALLFLLPRKLRKYLVILWDFALTVLAITDILFIRYYSDLFSFINLGLSTQVGEVSDSVFALFCLSDLLYFVDFPLLVLLARRAEFNKLTAKRALLVLLTILAGFFCVWYRFESYNKEVPGVLKTMWDKPAVCNNVGAVVYHLNDAKNTLRDTCFKGKISEEEAEKIRHWFEKRISNSGSEIYFGVAKGANLIIIQVESLQNFVVGRKINGKEITPNLNHFIKESYYFDHIYNQTAAGNSADAEFLANTGFYPAQSGVAYIRFARDDFEAMPKILADNGYETLAMHGDRPGFWNRQTIYPRLGFRHFVSKNEFEQDEIIGLGLSDRSFFRQSAEILSKTKQPFYAFLITLTSHYPYGWKEMHDQTKLNTGEFKGQLLGDYLVSMKYFDNCFGEFIASLKKNGLLEKTVVVVYGDHTAIPRWDRASLSRLLKRDLESAPAWCSEQTVPLIIRTPNAKLCGRGYQSGGLLDVSKTVMTLLGADYKYTLGRNLFDGSREEPVIFKTGAYVYGRNFIEPSLKEVHNLDSGKKLDYARFDKITEWAKEHHDCGNTLLEHNLLKRIKK